MHTENHLRIAADAGTVFQLARDVEHWPLLLSHYRSVTPLDAWDAAGARTVIMKARRGRIPVSWTSRQIVLPNEGRILYHHIAGMTRGMFVEWAIIPRAGYCDVSILHDLTPGSSLLTLPGVRWIAGSYFVHHIADLTLSGIRDQAERVQP